MTGKSSPLNGSIYARSSYTYTRPDGKSVPAPEVRSLIGERKRSVYGDLSIPNATMLLVFLYYHAFTLH